MRSVAALAMLTPLCVGQQFTVIPNSAATADAPTATQVPGFDGSLRHQILIDGSRFPLGFAGSTIDAVWFRRERDYERQVESGAAQLTLELSTATSSTTMTSTTFAANRGGNARTVFQGTISLPASPPPGGANVAWDAQNSVRIPFQTPYTGYAGGTLVLDFLGAPVTGNASPFWPVDATREAIRGTVQFLGTSCQSSTSVLRSTDGTTHLIGPSQLVPGNTADLFARAAVGANMALLIGTNTLPVPLPLASIGAPGCELQIDSLIATPPTAVVGPTVPGRPQLGGYVSQRLHIPHDARFFGAVFTSQWIQLTPQLAVTNAVASQVAGTLPSLGMVMVTAGYDGVTPPTEGSVRSTVAPVLRFEYR